MKANLLPGACKAFVLLLAAVVPGRALAHASEQGLVLLLPTDLYTGAGVAAVAATVVLLALLPAGWAARLFASVAVLRWRAEGARVVASCLSFLLLAALVVAGLAGPRDPLANPLPLVVWTVFWVGLVVAQGLLGNLWAWLNPWSGPLAVLRRLAGGWRVRRLRSGVWPGVATFLAFAGFLLADPAPADPDRLAVAVALYWLFTFGMALVFGPRWLRRGEGLSMALAAYARVGVFGRRGGRLRIGVPGWQILRGRAAPGMALLSVLILGTGSFDGVNETFWWLGVLGLNPFEFPGRSAIVWPTLAGMVVANLALVAVLSGCIWAGLRLVRSGMRLSRAFALFAPSVVPIALGYHVAHYLTSFMVDGQYALVALSDPFLTGADLLGLGEFYVTTGFFNTTGTVQVIYLVQAGAVVVGHVLAVLLAHALAVKAVGDGRRAALSQAPLALFMIGYTLFGLWLLASPRF
ncbi:hypothetical protein P1J78_07990 [Psychromarinibacter sp. C21-152]|uniref:Fenitrothion hydrolase n=1 Tax=Psychromarinibacter sediminicola TaxID=3033385 RepID=A0AAE3NQQ1_9RHOB|nr:hypothetical protein [Psychromarinibacter sediminicola]MDF0600666.1 hypothetical protein [Psychromarinibacter sediminicola]